MYLLRLKASWVYGLVSFVRNMLYDEHLLHSFSVSVPTVCVGNLAVGGTGKTPHTEFIARVLCRDFRVAVLSRGYKRRTRGFRLVDDAATAFTVGDEPMQMHLNLPDVPVAVCENRLRGIRHLMQLYPDLQVVLLDDAYQHRRLLCGYNVLLTPQSRLYIHDRLLPLGRLRESRYGALRAHAVVVTKCSEQMLPIDRRVIETSLHLAAWQQLCFSWLEYGRLQPLFPEFSVGIVQPDCKRPILLTAIADAAPLADWLKQRWPDLVELPFPDHHAYSRKDMRLLTDTFRRCGCDAVITTQKDAVRLMAANVFPDELKPVSWWQPVAVSMRGQEDAFLGSIRRYVAEADRRMKGSAESHPL